MASGDTQDRRQTIVPAPNNLQYIVAVIVMMILGVTAITAITVLRPGVDNTAVITAIIGFLAPTTLSLLAFMKSQETHLSVNSRLDAFMANAKLAAHAQGMEQGRHEGQQAADQRTDLLAGHRDVRQVLREVVLKEPTSDALPAASADIPQVEAPVIVVAPRKP